MVAPSREDKKWVIRMSVRDFALPSPLSGSIEADSGLGITSDLGREIHQTVQELRSSSFDQYEAEVKIQGTFHRDEFEFLVSGRMDGLFHATSGQPPRIEEIKSSFSLTELTRKLKDNRRDHPYRLQLLTYGYLFEKSHGVMPELTFLLVSSRSREKSDLKVEFDAEAYASWLDRRLEELVLQARSALKRTERRKRLSQELQFPFPSPRRGQLELIGTIEEGMREKKRLLLQAPTGLGKTVGVLYPTLKDALSRGKSVIYATPKNSQHAVAQDALEKFQEQGANLKGLTFTAKQKLCLKPEPLCQPEYCEYAKDYYDKLSRERIPETLARKRKLTSKTFSELGKQTQTCPFELQLEAVQEADVIICDYNYIFSAHSAFKRARELEIESKGLRNLLIDEAHNLPSRAMSYYSPEITLSGLSRIESDLELLKNRFADKALEALNDCKLLIETLRPEGSTESVPIKLDAELFVLREVELRSVLTQYLESEIEIQAKDPILRLTFYWGEFTEMVQSLVGKEQAEFFSLYLKEGGVKICCANASEFLRGTYDEFENVVGFSATLKPFDYYSRLSGLDGESLRTAEFQSPFDPEKRKILIIPQISTKYQDRNRNYGRIAEVIEKLSALKPGNHLVFFPSFDFMHQVSQKLMLPQGYRLFVQERNTPTQQIEALLETLKTENQPTLLFGVQGGVYSEGIDYPGDMAIGVFVIGPPLPTFDVEREKMRQYYDQTFSAGFDYAYAFPAMAKAIQAAGRVIRTEEDRGMIIFMDARFLEPAYSQSMPNDWFQTHPRELVSKSILKDLKEFWEKLNQMD